MSRPLEFRTASFSPPIAVTATGTFLADSERRDAVTRISPFCAAAPVALAAGAASLVCACADAAARAAMADAPQKSVRPMGDRADFEIMLSPMWPRHPLLGLAPVLGGVEAARN